MRLPDKFKALAALIALSVGATAAEPEPDPAELPRLAPTEPVDALETFKIVPGFRLELAAAEPMVVDPIAMAFNGPGKMFVVEMRGYSERRDEKLGRIRLLFDDDADGRFERSTVFARDLAWPTGVIAWKRGVFVIASPDILYFEDIDGNGVSDRREVVFTGFGAGAGRLNVQALPNNLKWGPDRRIHGATAGNGGRVGRPGSGERIDLRGADFSFDPEKLDIRAENGGGQYGLCFDELGRKFVCSNSNHIQAVIYPRRYADLGLPAARVEIAADGPAAEVFRISPDEPWRVVRTRWRVAKLVGGPVEGGGRVSGYFTAATGIAIYRGHAFIADAGSNLVHHKVLRYPGVQAIAERAAGERDIEFLASSDNWFRPVQVMPGPDGALYIADMYREVIEHPWSLPASIKKHLDLDSGNKRGRIYRIVPEKGALPEPGDEPRGVVERIIAAEQLDPLPATRREELIALAGHESAQVRFQLALTLGKLAGSWRTAPLIRLLASSGADRWLRAAALSALDAPPGEVFAQLTAMRPLPPDAALLGAVRYIASDGSDTDRTAAARFAAEVRPDLRFQVIELTAVFPPGTDAGSVAALAGNREKGASPERLAAIRLSGSRAIERLQALPAEPLAVQRAALETLRPASPDLSSATLVSHWGNIDDILKPTVVEFLLTSEDGSRALLRAIRDGSVARRFVDPLNASRLRDHPDEGLRDLARLVLGKEQLEPRSRILAAFRPALAMKGDRDSGRTHFLSRCASCHRAPDGSGIAFGPDVASFKAAGRESILTNFIDPNRELPPQYSAHIVELKDGRKLSGYLLSQDKSAVRLMAVGGFEQQFARTEVAKVSDLGISAMPAGLESGLSVQDVADLLAFLSE